MGVSTTVILLTAAGFLAMVVGLVVNQKNAARLTGGATLLAALGGFFCYGYGFSQQVPFSPLAVVRAVLASLGMFLGRNDFSAVNGTALFAAYPAQLLFWLVHLIALFATASAALTTIGASAMRRLRLLLVFRGRLELIYGVGPESISFGRKLADSERRHTLVFVDTQMTPAQAGEVAAMGAVAFTAPNALKPDGRFLRSIGMRPGRQLTLYAMDQDAGKNLQYAADLLSALEQRGISPRQLTLILSGGEDCGGESLQAWGDRYGYGSVTLFDDAALAARLLVQDYPPCDAVAFDAEGRATQDFEALVVGFGRVGQAVLRQLVMNGQFEGSRFRLAVFSPDCEQVNGALASSGKSMLEAYQISFHPFDGRSREMYGYLTQRKDSLKYIVVCTGDPKRNREIAQELTGYLSRLQSEAAVYQCSYQGVIRHGPGGRLTVHRGIYTPQVLCTQGLDRMAMALNQCYCAGNGRSTWENWAGCDYFSRLSSRASADFIPALLRASGKTAEQVLSGDWDLTEAQLENLSRTEHLRWCAFHYAMGFDAMDRETFLARCRERKAQLDREGRSELRPGRDMLRRLHACLIPWEELDGLSAAENAVTGGKVDYKAMDRNNVLLLPRVLKAEKSGGEESA